MQEYIVCAFLGKKIHSFIHSFIDLQHNARSEYLFFLIRQNLQKQY